MTTDMPQQQSASPERSESFGLPEIPDSIDEYREHYYRLSIAALSVSDVDTRRTIRSEITAIDGLKQRVISGDVSFDDGELRMLDIMTQSETPALVRVSAMIGAYDIAVSTNRWDDETTEIIRDVLTSADEADRILLLGALYARETFRLVQGRSQDEAARMAQEFYTSLIAKHTSDRDALVFAGIEGACRALTTVLLADDLRVHFANVLIHEGDGQTEPTIQDIAGIPESLMILRERGETPRVPQHHKLVEGVRLGVPTKGKLTAERGVLRLLVGVEVPGIRRMQKDGRNILVHFRNLYHVSLAGLRIPQDGKLIGFDSLTYILSSEISHDQSMKNKISRAKDFETARKIAAETVSWYIDRLSDPVVAYEDGRTDSILSVALKEAAARTGVGIGVEEARAALYKSVAATAFEKEGSALLVRTRHQIADMYRDHVWHKELSDEDKLEFAWLCMEDPQCGLWPLLREENLSIPYPKPSHIDEYVREPLLAFVNRHYKEILKVRAVTIRDNYGTAPVPQEE